MAHRMVHWLVAALVVVPLATACDAEVVSGTPSVLTNGLENSSPFQVQQAAIDALTTAGWQALGVPEAAELLADKWVKGPMDMEGPDEQLTIDLLVSAIEQAEVGLRPTVVQTTVGAERAVMVTYRNGDKLYVANTGAARPLRVSSVGIGDLDFSEHGVDFQITAPPDAIDSTQP